MSILSLRRKETESYGGKSKTNQDSGELYGKIHYIDPDCIVPNPNQPRRFFDDNEILRLADSIRQHGLLQPLTVRALSGGKYELIAGERRLRALKLLRMTHVSCVVMQVSDSSSAELAIIENLQREGLNLFEQASAIEKLMSIYHYTQAQVADKLSLSQSAVANKLRLLKFTQNERTILLQNGCGERQARAFLKLPPDLRERAIQFAVERRMNVMQTEEYIERLLGGEKPDHYFPDGFGATSGQIYVAKGSTTKDKRGRPSKDSSRKIVFRDLKLFYNTIDHAVEILRQAGVAVDASRAEGDDVVTLTIRIPKEPRTP